MDQIFADSNSSDGKMSLSFKKGRIGFAFCWAALPQDTVHPNSTSDVGIWQIRRFLCSVACLQTGDRYWPNPAFSQCQLWVFSSQSCPQIRLVHADANYWSGRMQAGGQARAFTQQAASYSKRAGVLRPATPARPRPVSTELRCCGPQHSTGLPNAALSSTKPMQQIPF